MANLAWVWLPLIAVLHVVHAETARSHWQVPNGHSGINFEETWYIGDTIHVRWAGWNSTFTSDLMDNTTEAQLYVVAWNPDYSSYSSLLSCMRSPIAGYWMMLIALRNSKKGHLN